MIDQLSVRPAEISDAEAAAAIWLENMEIIAINDRRFQIAPEGKRQFAEAFHAAITESTQGVYVAIRRGRVMGYIWGAIQSNNPGLLPEQIGVVRDLAADTHGHGGGVGTLLFEALTTWFTAHGITVVVTQTPVAAVIAQAFWTARHATRIHDGFWMRLAAHTETGISD